MGLDFKDVMDSITNIPKEVLRPALHTLEMATMGGNNSLAKVPRGKSMSWKSL